MWIPVIVIAWSLGGNPVWVNFPMVNFPFTSEFKCQAYIAQVKNSVTKDPQYLDGYSTCINLLTKPGGSPT